jgi:two-component system CheB/CheR fusion protein
MAFVIAPHRGIAHADLLLQLLRLATRMPVAEVMDGMCVEPNCVFVMPAHQDMTLDGDVFQLRTATASSGWPKTINIFLHSLAIARGSRTVAVILSGMDGDGSAALRNIKAAGGVTFAQSDASYDSMPRRAMETGDIDFLLPSIEIAAALLKLARDQEFSQ